MTIFRCEPKEGKFCYRWNCYHMECRERRIWAETKRISLGIERMREIDAVWFLTSYRSSSSSWKMGWNEITDFSDQVSKLFGTLRYHAKKTNIELIYAKIFAAKGATSKSPFEVHFHAIVSWIPCPESIGTVDYPYRYKSDILVKRASALDLNLWIEFAYNPQPLIKGYFHKNLSHLEAIRLPPFFRRVSYSRNYPKMDWQIRRDKRRKGLS